MPLDGLLTNRLHLLRGYTAEDLISGPRPQLLAAFAAFGAPVAGYRSPDAVVREREVPGPHGGVRVRIYQPLRQQRSGIGVVLVHGGGFSAGDLDMPEVDATARELCARATAVIVSVDYRLAQDGVHFPVPHDDVHAAWCWTLHAAPELGIEPTRLALGGGSAGGNLAAGVALRLRDEGSPPPSRLLLAYPLLHYELPPFADAPDDMESLPPLLRFLPENIAQMNDNYLGGTVLTPYAFPALGDLAGLRPTFILTSEYDDLRPSGAAFAQALREAGVKVTERCEPGVPHGHLNIPGLPRTESSLRFLATALTADLPAA